MDLLIDRYHYTRDMLLCIGSTHYSHSGNVRLGPMSYLGNDILPHNAEIDITLGGRLFRLYSTSIIEYSMDAGCHSVVSIIRVNNTDINTQYELKCVVELVEVGILQLVCATHISVPLFRPIR